MAGFSVRLLVISTVSKKHEFVGRFKTTCFGARYFWCMGYRLGTIKTEILLFNLAVVGRVKKMQYFKHWSGCTSGVSRSCYGIAKGLA